MSAVFISHGSRDNLVANELRQWLERSGHRSIFLDFGNRPNSCRSQTAALRHSVR